jgi:spermidine synthase
MAVLMLCAPLSQESRAEDLEVVESKYNTIIINKRENYLSMRFGYNTQLYTESVYNTDDPSELPVEYTRKMLVGLAYVQGVGSVVEIGSGGGRFATFLSALLQGEAGVTTVELDEEVIRLSEKYFGLVETETLKITHSDGRLFLMKGDAKYDMIVVDAYRGPFVPFHLLTKEFYDIAKGRLSDGGVLVQNVEPSTMLFESAISTIGAVFENVDIYPAGGNVVVVAYNGPQKSNEELLAQARIIDSRFKSRYPVGEIVAGRLLIDKLKITAETLTDDFAPVEYLRSIEMHNRRYEEITK